LRSRLAEAAVEAIDSIAVGGRVARIRILPEEVRVLKAAEALTQAVHSKHEKVRLAAVQSLGQLFPEAANREITRSLSNSDAKILSLPSFNEKPEVVKSISDLLNRVSWVQALERDPIDYVPPHPVLETVDTAAISALIAAMNDSSGVIREAAAGALGNIGPKAEAAVDALIRELHDTDEDAAAAAAYALGQIGQAAQHATPVLMKVASDNKSSSRLRLDSVQSLGLLGDTRAINTLLQLFEEPDPKLRHAVAQALGIVGLPEQSAISTLITHLNDADQSVGDRAAEAIEKVALGAERLARTDALPALRSSAVALGKEPRYAEHGGAVSSVVHNLELMSRAKIRVEFFEWLRRHWAILAVILGYSLLMAF
jgi:HEAT repeat protein